MAAYTIVCDIDSVLTDGKQYITSDGQKLFKAFHSRDVSAIRELIFNGIRVVLCTADNDGSGQHFANKVGAEFLYLRDKSQIGIDKFIAVGDSAWDVRMLMMAHHRFCPLDAEVVVRDLPGMVILKTKGGQGVMSEIIHLMKEMKLL